MHPLPGLRSRLPCRHIPKPSLLARGACWLACALPLLATACGTQPKADNQAPAPLSVDQFGPAGPQGPPGSPGADGQPGPAGPAGPDGQLRIYGDASAGNVTATASTDLFSLVPSLNLQFHDFTVNPGVILTVPSGTVIRCDGTFRNDGSIVVKNGDAGGFDATSVAGQGVSHAPAGNGERGNDQALR